MSDLVVLNSSQIVDVDGGRLSYLDTQGQAQQIDFEDCYQRYLKRRLNPAILKLPKDPQAAKRYEERIREWKEVGRRQPLEPPWDDGPFIEFHTEPRIRFKFDSFDGYDKVLSLINDAGWETFDQS